MIILEAVVQFFPLGVRKGNRFRYRGYAVPEIFNELDALIKT